jgi:hypothetical protein
MWIRKEKKENDTGRSRQREKLHVEWSRQKGAGTGETEH